MQQLRKRASSILLILGILIASGASAEDITSTHFIVRDPMIGTGGGYGSSGSFQLIGAGNTLLSGSGSSASYIGREGFLWYPYVTQGVFNVALIGTTANLTWGASNAGLGWNVTGYNVGYSAVSGGPYSYTDVGNVTSTSYPGLTPGQYCYVLQTYDAFANVIATSPEQCVTVTASLTFTNDDASIGFGTLSSASVRYANGAGNGSAGDTTAHTFSISTNAPNGYSLTYRGAKLTSGSNSINAATNIATGGTSGTSQFAFSGILTGSGSMDSGYNHVNWSSVDNVTTQIASASGTVAGDTIDMHYQANITSTTPAGTYATTLTYVVTGTF